MFETKIGSYVVFTLGLSYISTRIYTLLYECVKCVKLNFHTHAKLQFDQQTLKTILKYQYHFVKGSWWHPNNHRHEKFFIGKGTILVNKKSLRLKNEIGIIMIPIISYSIHTK